MQQSELFTKTIKNAPKDEITVNAQLLTRAGFVYKVMAGVYSYLPLGLRVLNKVRNVIRQEMDKIGGQEILMSSLHPAENWKKTGGWDGIDILFKVKSRTKKDYALGQSHEEIVTPLAKEIIQSYRDLPLAVYQIHWKFRDELRAKSGLLRGREFEMKDMYSFHESQEDFEKFYEIVKKAYLESYKKLGLVAKVTEASGGAFTEKVSYEFEVLTDAGEANILYCPSCDFCVNTDDIKTYKEKDNCPSCKKDKLEKARASEVGNVFDLGQKYAKDFDLAYTDKNCKKKYPFMGCYGWGTTRTMGVLVEKFHDKKGMIWPEAVAPFRVHLIGLSEDEKTANNVYQELIDNNIEVLYDDREDKSAGEKFADADLIGIPYRVVVSDKTLENDSVEIKRRDSDKAELVKIEDIDSYVK
ncbi:MAG: aminoacyl--tRNA ligase-related protein [Candidatus Portnoybacteria bacterium]